MYAVVKTGGKQYRVEPGKVFRVEKLSGDTGDELFLRDVMMVRDDDVHIGQPLLENHWVRCQIVKQGRNRKIVVFKQKRRKGYRLKRGHKQYYTALRAEEIGKGEMSQEVLPESEEAMESSPTEEQ